MFGGSGGGQREDVVDHLNVVRAGSNLEAPQGTVIHGWICRYGIVIVMRAIASAIVEAIKSPVGAVNIIDQVIFDNILITDSSWRDRINAIRRAIGRYYGIEGIMDPVLAHHRAYCSCD